MTYLRKNSKRKKPVESAIIEPDTPAPQDTPILQNWFLEHVKSNGLRVAIFLCSGVRLDGQILAYDDDTLLLSDRDNQVVYLKAIVSISATSRKLPSQAP